MMKRVKEFTLTKTSVLKVSQKKCGSIALELTINGEVPE